MNELIEKQIEDASEMIAAFWSALRTGHMLTKDEVLGKFCEKLIQIIQNQQWQIEALEENHKTTDAILHGLVMNPKGMRQMVDDVKREVLE